MLTLRANISQGKLPTSVKRDIQQFLLENEGKLIELTLKKARSKRSEQQNSYYWAAVIPIIRQALKDLGHKLTAEDTHFFLKQKFHFKRIANADGVDIGEVAQSTTTMTKTEFCEYIDNIAQWSAEILNIVIPEPNTQVDLNF